jgi:hypothetical protein
MSLLVAYQAWWHHWHLLKARNDSMTWNVHLFLLPASFISLDLSLSFNMISVHPLTTNKNHCLWSACACPIFRLKVYPKVVLLCNVCRHYLVIPIEHIPTVNDLRITNEDHQLGGFSELHISLACPTLTLRQPWIAQCPYNTYSFSVSHMVKVGKDLLGRDAPRSEEHRYC